MKPRRRRGRPDPILIAMFLFFALIVFVVGVSILSRPTVTP